ncbi:MAG: AmmeMemoRadiSam system protein B [Chlamydiae bacterium]|nr:AmmeMemoRadiSam system protein B [Chlamydiota bacterium]MBI3277391.1 AmmeMemoRadiSam system protein B [Chlamydiota bacterium]
MSSIREPAVAGLFYPNSLAQLRADILSFLEKAAGIALHGELVGLILPHAGFPYSGQIAACGYHLLQSLKLDAVIIIGPNHKVEGFQGTSVYAKGGFKTPLGVLEVDEELAEDILSRDSGAVFNEKAHLKEHSLEVHVPFLQVVSPQVKMVPIVMADYQWKTCERLARAVVKAIKKRKEKKILLIASTDLSHYHSYEEALKMDKIAIQDIESMDPGRLYMDAAHQERSELCGFGPVLTTLIASRELGATKAKTLASANSGDVTEDWSRVVGYVSMAIMKGAMEGEEWFKEMEEAFLDEIERKALCEWSRKTLEAYFEKKSPAPPEHLSSKFLEKKSLFVTLKKRNELRGCVGSLSQDKTLLEMIKEMTLSAAFRDSRFPPLQQEELDKTAIEISILTDLVQISSTDSIELGKHGILIRKENHSGLFLPQVALEQGWDKETFLTHACLKAGLEMDAWKEGSIISIFEVFRFGENAPLLMKR